MLDFNDPRRWVIQAGIPVLDEHELVGQDGSAEGFVDSQILQQIAANNNRRVRETGDPAPLIIGHTSDHPNAPERPVVGYAINYRVLPFRNGRKAIYVDFAVRRKYAHVLDDYPRRSVELWLSKKELDPIALLGGTTPERDLGVTIRRSRAAQHRFQRELARAKADMHLQAVSLLGSTAPARDLGVILRYSRAAGGNVLQYAMEEDKVGKVMHEFKHGTLHSGSKRGPKVTSRDQAIAIAMHESGKSKYGMGEDCGMGPHRYNEGPPDDMDDQDDGMGDDGMGDDGGDDGFDAGDPGAGSGQDIHDGPPPAEDPEIGRLLSSPTFKNMLREVVQQVMEESGLGGGGMGGGMDQGMDDGMGAEPPPPMGAGAPMGAPGGVPGGAPGGMGGSPDDEAAMFHGAQPVRFGEDEEDLEEEPLRHNMGSGFGGPASGFASSTNFGPKPTHGKRNMPFSRNGHSNGKHPMNGTRTRGNQPARPGSPLEQEVRRLQRSNQALVMKLARADATQAVASLKAEGVIFGDTPEEAQRNEQEEINFLSELDENGQKWHLSRIRRLYKRVEQTPAGPAQGQYPGQPGFGGYPGGYAPQYPPPGYGGQSPAGPVSRYARGDANTQQQGQQQAEDDFEPQTPQEAMEYADQVYRLQRSGKNPTEAATAAGKVMLQRRGPQNRGQRR